MKIEINYIIKKVVLAFVLLLCICGCNSKLGDFPSNFKTPSKLIIEIHKNEKQHIITDAVMISKIIALMENSYEISPRNCKCMASFKMHFLNEIDKPLSFYFFKQHSESYYEFSNKNRYRISKSELKNIIQSNGFDISKL